MLNTNSNPICGILYIDDEEKALKYFRMAFAQKYQVFTATSGAEGIDLLRREAANIGIVISDQRMPGMLGAEVLGVVREEFPQIVRILTTAYSDLESAIQAVNKGHIYQYVVKPWEIPDLGMVLQRAADYFLVMAERNGLLALKMNILQRLVCGDRLEGLLLGVRGWPADRRTIFQRALGALVNNLPAGGGSFQTDAKTFRPRDFEAGAVILEAYQNAGKLLDSLEGGGASIRSLATALEEKFGPAQTGDENGRWTVEFSGAVDSAVLTQTVFGVLAERAISGEALAVFQGLMDLAGSGGSLRIVAGGAEVARFDLSGAVPSPGDIIETLYQKYSEWDIASR